MRAHAILRSWGEWWCRTHTHIHPCLPLILRSYALPYIHTQVAVYWRVGWWWHTIIPMPTLDCLHRHIFLLHVYRSVSLARMRRYMQLAYLFHQRAKSLLSRDSHIADCTVRHLGVKRPFSSLFSVPGLPYLVAQGGQHFLWTLIIIMIIIRLYADSFPLKFWSASIFFYRDVTAPQIHTEFCVPFLPELGVKIFLIPYWIFLFNVLLHLYFWYIKWYLP